MDEWSKSQNISSEQTDRTEQQPPPQAHTNAVFTGSGKSDDPSRTQKDSPPPIIVNNKIKKDKPIKTTKKAIMFDNLVALELMLDHHLLDRSAVKLLTKSYDKR
ncbi:hypothetical protein Tco_1399454 [Tanacetum coccineum]